MQLAKPVPGPIKSRFGYRPPLRYHNGIDFGWLYADPTGSRRVVAPVDGVVTASTFGLVAGKYIIIQPADTRFRVRLIHLASRAVQRGDRVRVGQFVGVMGDTGTSTRQVHLHMDVYRNGTRVNPEPYITRPYPGEHALAGDDGTPIPEEIDMSGTAQFFERIGSRTQEFMRGDPTDPALYPKGYEVTTDINKARLWGRQISGEGTEPVHLVRDLYVAQQAWLTAEAARHRTAQLALLREATGQTTPTDMKPVLDGLNSIRNTLARIFR